MKKMKRAKPGPEGVADEDGHVGPIDDMRPMTPEEEVELNARMEEVDARLDAKYGNRLDGLDGNFPPPIPPIGGPGWSSRSLVASGPGWKTSEFWLTLLTVAALCVLCVIGDATSQIIAVVAVTLALLSYTISRTVIKIVAARMNRPEDDFGYVPSVAELGPIRPYPATPYGAMGSQINPFSPYTEDGLGFTPGLGSLGTGCGR